MKKGQAAMEFLMTYGWAILVVLAAIGALAYFGVLSPDRFMPSKCIVTGGFSCSEYKITATGVQMKIQNNLGVDATGVTITLNSTGANVCDVAYGPVDINNGADTGLQTYACDITGRYKGDIGVFYSKSGEEVTHTTTGSVSGNIEQ